MWPGDRTRVRTRDSASPLVTSYGFYDYYGNLVWYPQPAASSMVQSTNETIVDDKPVPGVCDRSEKRCYHVKNVVEVSTAQIIRWYGGYWIKQPVAAYVTPPQAQNSVPASAATVIPDVLADFLSGVDPLKGVMQGLPFIGELGKTKDMIRKPFKFLTQDWPRLGKNAYRRMRRRVENGRHISLAEQLVRTGFDKGSNLWLEAHYGWDPLFMDLAAVVSACSSFSSEYDRYRKGDPSWTKFSSQVTLNRVENVLEDYTFDRLLEEIVERLKVTGRYRVKPAGSTSAALSYPNFIASKLGLNLQSVLSAGLELTPYSFVLDWFIPVGDMLSKLTDTRCEFDLDRVSYHHTIKGTQTRLFNLGQPLNHPYGQAEKTLGWIEAWTATSERYSRNWGIPQPGGLAFGGLTTTKVASALSLIAQRLHLPLK